MSLSSYLQNILDKYKHERSIYLPIVTYFEKNSAARKYAEVCEENKWECILDHLTVRTCDIDKAAEKFIRIGYVYDETIDYKNEGWFAKIYRHPTYPPCFIDESYEDASDEQKIIKKWVDRFGDREFHHIAVRLPQGIGIEEAMDYLNKKGINFPGRITGPKGTRLRQIFTQAEVVDGYPYSVLELTQRNIDSSTGKIYTGFIHEQADSLMKDSVL